MRSASLCLLFVTLAAGAALAAANPVELASVSARGAAGNGGSDNPAVSADGRFVAFESEATNLVPGDQSPYGVYVRDTATRKTVRVGAAPDGSPVSGQRPSISADGRFVAFDSSDRALDPTDHFNFPDVYLYDRETGETRRVSTGLNGETSNHWCWKPSLSADGRYVAYEALASNLVEGDTNDHWDIFVYDRVEQTTARASIGWNGAPANSWSSRPHLSADGRFVAFSSNAGNLVEERGSGAVDYYVRDMVQETTEQVSVADYLPATHGWGTIGRVTVSDDGRFAAFETSAPVVESDLDQFSDIYVRDRLLQTTERASLTYRGEAPGAMATNASISGDGRYVAFLCNGSTLVDAPLNYDWHVYVRDRDRGTTERVSMQRGTKPDDAYTSNATLSADGMTVVFSQRLDARPPRPSLLQVYAARRAPEAPELPARLQARGKLTFSALPVGASRDRKVELRNTGQATIRGTVSPLEGPFQVTAGVGGFTLAPGARHSVVVTFTPAAVGRFNSELVVEVENPNAKDLRLPIRGISR